MKYKLIALDLDGTLLDSKGSISNFTANILKELELKGVKIVIATGRSYSSLKPKIHILKLEYPVICYNGAMIRDGKTDEIIHDSNLPEDIAKDLIKVSRRDNITLVSYINGDFYYEKETIETQKYAELTGLSGIKVNFDKLKQLSFTKCILIDEHQTLINLEKEFIPKFNKVGYIAFSKPTFLEFMDISASKAKALDSVAKTYGIKQHEIIAFGDGLNDLEMLEYAGKGIVMKNGFQSLKDKFENSDFTNDQDGVAKYMEKLLNA
ncbi:MAG: Cof-type HAD-IIB family hydrolase [Spirochaetaceae bacterium]